MPQWDFISEKHRELYEALAAGGKYSAARAGPYWVFGNRDISWVVGYDGVRRGHFVHVLPETDAVTRPAKLSAEALRRRMGYDFDCEPCSPYVPGRYRVHGDVVLEVREAAPGRRELCRALAEVAGEGYMLLLREALLRWVSLTISSAGLPARVSGEKVVVMWPDCSRGTPCHADPSEASAVLAAYLEDAARAAGLDGLRVASRPGDAHVVVGPREEGQEYPVFEEVVPSAEGISLEVTVWPDTGISPEVEAAHREAVEALEEECMSAEPGEVAGSVYRHSYVLEPAVEVRTRLRMRFPGLGAPLEQDFLYLYALPGARLRLEHPERPAAEIVLRSAATVAVRSMYTQLQAGFFASKEVEGYEP